MHIAMERSTPRRPLPATADTSIVAETGADALAREALLDRAMGPGRKRKSSERLRRGRRPSEGLAFVARSADGAVVGTVRLWDIAAGDNGPAALLLGPLAVEPGLKDGGLGSAGRRHAGGGGRRLRPRAVLPGGDAADSPRLGCPAARPGAP